MALSIGAIPAQLRQSFGIRLVNLNVIPDGFTQATSPDLEVDFDDIVLSATTVPEPATGLLLGMGCCAGVLVHRLAQRRRMQRVTATVVR